MTKRKHRENPPKEPTEKSPVSSEIVVDDDEPDSCGPCPAQGESIMDEVEAFLIQRADLAQKLADEIAATEQKLAELKKTAAMLFPENNGSASKERKPKKARPKASVREGRLEATASSEESPARDAAA